MPNSRLTSNIRKSFPRRTRSSYLSIVAQGVETTGISASGTTGFVMGLSSPQYGFVQTEAVGTTPTGDTGREAKITLNATGNLTMTVDIEDNIDRFVLIKQVSPVMPDPAPIDSKGKPT